MSQVEPDFDQFSSWALSDPEAAIAELDRHIVAQDGLSGFIPLSWHLIEGASTPYVSNWHIDAICEHLMGVSAGHIKRLAIAVPPRHMNSCSAAILAAFRQEFHFWPCADFPGHLYDRVSWVGRATTAPLRPGAPPGSTRSEPS